MCSRLGHQRTTLSTQRTGRHEMLMSQKIGQGPSDGVAELSQLPLRGETTGSVVTSEAHGRYHDAVSAGRVFSLMIANNAITVGNLLTTVIPGQQNMLCLANPTGSGVDLALLKFMDAFVNNIGFRDVGPIWHGVFYTDVTTDRFNNPPQGVARNHLIGGPTSSALVYWITAVLPASAGLPVPLMMSGVGVNSVNSVLPSQLQNQPDMIDGAIVLPPGTAWTPLWASTSPSEAQVQSITWEEIPRERPGA